MQTLLYDAAGARAIDAHAIDDCGIAGIDLMRSAATAAERVVRGRFPHARQIVVACGSGNNGGDGYEVARLLRQHLLPLLYPILQEVSQKNYLLLFLRLSLQPLQLLLFLMLNQQLFRLFE